MPNRRVVVALVSFVVGLSAVVGTTVPFEGLAHAQRGGAPRKRDPKKDKEKEEKEKKEAEAAAASSSSSSAAEEERKKKAAEEAAKKPEETPPPEKKEFDDTVEAEKAVFITGDIGFTRADLGTIVDKTGFDQTAANGTLWGFSGGYRYKDLRGGLRWRVYDTTEFTLWSVALQAGYSMKFRPVTPIFNAHLGYVFSQSTEAGLYRNAIPSGAILPPNIDVKGLLLGGDVNASYWVTKWFRLGAFIGVDFMLLSRERGQVPRSITGAPPPEIVNHPIYTEAGFGFGMNVIFGFRAAFDIGLQ